MTLWPGVSNVGCLNNSLRAYKPKSGCLFNSNKKLTRLVDDMYLRGQMAT